MKNLVLVGILFVTTNALSAELVVPQVIEIQATEKGFEPQDISVKSGVPIILKVTRKTDDTCATDIEFKSKKIKKKLPLNKSVRIDLGTLAKGDVPFACGMKMFKGMIHVQ
ncbi:MAG: cupredoxin domain-containing protein [Bdellovibrionaceae bacterium]|nr:cupredoxin domain-containing protein [Bdellovibrio sp.]